MAIISRMEQLCNDLEILEAGTDRYVAKTEEIIRELDSLGVKKEAEFESALEDLLGARNVPKHFKKSKASGNIAGSVIVEETTLVTEAVIPKKKVAKKKTVKKKKV